MYCIVWRLNMSVVSKSMHNNQVKWTFYDHKRKSLSTILLLEGKNKTLNSSEEVYHIKRDIIRTIYYLWEISLISDRMREKEREIKSKKLELPPLYS